MVPHLKAGQHTKVPKNKLKPVVSFPLFVYAALAVWCILLSLTKNVKTAVIRIYVRQYFTITPTGDKWDTTVAPELTGVK